MSEKRKALVIVSLMTAILLILSLYTVITCNRKEIKNTIRIYGDLIETIYRKSEAELPAYYRKGMNHLLQSEATRQALAAGDRQKLREITRTYYDFFKQHSEFLEEINYYSAENKPLLRFYDAGAIGERPVLLNPLLPEIRKSRKEVGSFFVGETGVHYRMLMPLPVDKQYLGALEFVVDAAHFTSNIDEMLNLKSTILVKVEPGGIPIRGWKWEEKNGYYWWNPGELFHSLMGHISMQEKHQEVTAGQRTILVHNTLALTNAGGKRLGNILVLQDITERKRKLNRTILLVAVISVFLLAIMFVVLYHSFGRLVEKILERESQLKVMNEELEMEIIERKAIEEELVLHRDHLEGLITEGTRELQIKNQEIEASEKKFRTITSSVRDAIVMVDGLGRVSFWNTSASRIFGYTYREMQGKELYKLIVPDYHKPEKVEAFKIFQEADKEGEVGELIEVEARRKSGDVFPIEITAATVNIQEQLHTVAVIRDITQRKEAEKERRVLSSAVRQSSVIVVITDTQGTIQYVNPKFTEVTGYSREEALGRDMTVFYSDMHRPEFYNDLWATLRSGEEWRGELYNKKKNGDLYWESSRISPIKDTGEQITHFVFIKEDITERKRMEIELIAAKKSAEAASRSKSEFLANMSHELRTPMNAIIGMTELVLDTKVSKEQKEYLRIVQQSSNALLGLLNDILDLSKIEEGKLNLEPLPFDLRKTLTESAKTLGVQAHNKNLELVYHIDSEVPHQLLGDEGRLRQILVNLIGNSIKFTEKGEIVFTVDVLEQFADGKVLLHFLISDTGIGIPEKKLEEIFEKFYQADASITRKYGGSGLGLTISSNLVRLMDGIIWAESPASFPHFARGSKGSTLHFTATFGARPESEEDQARREIDVEKLKDLPLLIVDDNETNRRFLQEILSKYGLKPEMASSGPEALAMLKKKAFSVLILDFQMPGMDGGTVLEILRNELKLDIPAVLLSSGVRKQDIERIGRQGISAHFFKPINSHELLEAIMVIMGYQEAEPDVPEEPEEEPAELELNGVDMLVAEDNPINQRLIKRLLELKGHRVDIACNGKEAIDMFDKRAEGSEAPYRIIFMDIQMPEMDGIHATKEIRKKNTDIPIIALTAHAMKGDKSKFLAQGMNDYVSKPIRKSLLYDLVEKYIREEKKKR